MVGAPLVDHSLRLGDALLHGFQLRGLVFPGGLVQVDVVRLHVGFEAPKSGHQADHEVLVGVVVEPVQILQLRPRLLLWGGRDLHVGIGFNPCSVFVCVDSKREREAFPFDFFELLVDVELFGEIDELLVGAKNNGGRYKGLSALLLRHLGLSDLPETTDPPLKLLEVSLKLEVVFGVLHFQSAQFHQTEVFLLEEGDSFFIGDVP